MLGIQQMLWGAMMLANSQNSLDARPILDGAAATAQPEKAVAATTVRVLAWNVFDLPELVFSVASHARMERVVAALEHLGALPLGQVDAVVLTELYNAADKRLLLQQFAKIGFGHHVQLEAATLFDAWRMRGVVVVSRWPIERTASMAFRNACHGLDCFAAKGCVYARLLKTTPLQTQPINLFATHFYLGKPNRRQENRRHQARAMQKFIETQAPSADEMTLVAGDFNAPWHLDGPAVLTTLGAFAVRPTGSLDHTFVGEGHILAGSPRRSLALRAQAAQEQVATGKQLGRKWIDYVAAVAPGRAPQKSVLEAFEVRGTPYSLGVVDGRPLLADALSDHHAVLGTLYYAAHPNRGAPGQ